MVVTKEEEEFGPIKTLYNEMSEVRDERRIVGGTAVTKNPRGAGILSAPVGSGFGRVGIGF